MGEQGEELTGFFSDGVRRIDLVLVTSDEKYKEDADKLELDFLINVIKIGLEIEVEPARMKEHEKLMFVKVHAPAPIIEEYGKYFNIRKYFKETHNEFINPNENRFFMKDEKDFIKTIRKSYPGPLNYTNIERSTIVYHILLSLPFGRHENFIGLQRLLEKNIITDAYALHDGPYFYTGKEIPKKINGRQVLFYNWVGKKYSFYKQPDHLIREYLGEKVGIYFAYYEYFHISLIIATLLGIFVSFEGLCDMKGNEVIKEACDKTNKSLMTICPLCRDFNICPFRNLTEYCAKVTITNFIDNRWTMIYCILISVWAMLFILLWRRRQNYLCWLWEYDQTDTRIAVRSEFQADVNKIRKSKLTGIITETYTIHKRIGRLVITALFLLVWVLLVFTITVSLIIWKFEVSAKFTGTTWRDYWALIIITCVNVIIMSILQKSSSILCYHLNRFENHKTYYSFETSYVTKLFGCGFVCNFTLLMIFYFLNILHTYPADKDRWYLIAGIGIINCGPESCLDELFVALVTTVLVKEYIFRLPTLFLKTKSEYSKIKSKVPCWEREYFLAPITENVLIEKFNNLVLKFTLVGLFGTVFPLISLLLLISGICNLRHEARQFVVGSRRPLLRQPCSHRAWYKIMLAVVYAVPCFNTVAMTWMTTMLRYSRTDYGSSYFYNSMGRFITEDYNKVTGPGSPAEAIKAYKGFVPEVCLFPGLRFRSKKLDGEYYPIEKFWRIRHDKHALMLEIEHLALLFMVILHYVTPAYPRDVTDTMSAEQRIKRRKR